MTRRLTPEAVAKELFFELAGVDDDDVGVPVPGLLESGTRPDRDPLERDPAVLLESVGQDVEALWHRRLSSWPA